MVIGELPVPEATAGQVRTRAAMELASMKVDRSEAANGLLDYRDGILEGRLHLVNTNVRPVLNMALSVRLDDPLVPWRLSKDEAIRLISEDEPLGREIHLFHRLLTEYYPDASSVDLGLDALERGLGFRRLAKEWYASLEE